MAVTALSAVSAVLNLVYGPGVTETLRRDSVLMNVVRARPMANSTATWRVKIGARNTAAEHAEGYDVQSSDFSTDTRLQATLNWAHYEAYAAITGTAQRISTANSARQNSGYGTLLDEEMMDAANELTVKMSTHCYSGSEAASPVQLGGLARAVKGSVSYAGIDPATYTTWIAGENTDSLANLTLDLIRRKAFRPVLDATGKRPDIAILPGALHDLVSGLIDPAQRVILPFMAPVGPNGTPQQVNLASLGFTGFMLDGVPFVEDRHCTTNTIYAGSLADIEFQQTPPEWTSMDPGQIAGMIKELNGRTVPIDLITQAIQNSTSRLTAQINALSKTGDSTKCQLVLDAQLCLKRRNAWAKLTLS